MEFGPRPRDADKEIFWAGGRNPPLRRRDEIPAVWLSNLDWGEGMTRRSLTLLAKVRFFKFRCWTDCVLGGISGSIGGFLGGRSLKAAEACAFGGVVGGWSCAMIVNAIPSWAWHAGCLGGGIGNLISQVCQGSLHSRECCSWLSLASSIVTGGISGAAARTEAHAKLIAFITGIDIGMITGVCGGQ